MRTTFVLSLDDDLFDFLESQPGMVDPSSFINQLIQEEMDRVGWQAPDAPSDTRFHAVVDAEQVALERFLDEDIQAAD